MPGTARTCYSAKMNYDHKKIIETIAKLDEPPSKPEDVALWLRGDAHISFLQENANADELVVFASGEHT